MKKEEREKSKAKLSLIAAFRYFLKGNMIFAFNGIVLYIIDTVFHLFPPLFQQVFTDNIITHKHPQEPGMVYPADGHLHHAVLDRNVGLDSILHITP